MSKFAAVPAVVVLLLASTVSAQVYSQPSSYSGGCVIISSDLSYGSRGGEVTKLQQFLVSQNYPGGGSWMITGYFGQATVQAVRNFQQSSGLPMTGYLDSATRQAIQTRTCGLLAATLPTLPSTSITFPPTIPAYTSPTYPQPSINFPYSIYPYGGVSITSLSTQNAQVGQTITVTGSGFDTTGTNTVHVGTATIVVPSNGTSLSFTAPSVPNGTYSVYITNSRGTSNSLTLSITQAQSVCNTAPWYQPWNWFGQQQYQCGIYSNVNLNSITPNWAAVGTTIKLKGTGFSPTGNTVYMGGNIIGVISSTNSGTEISFTVPTQFQGPYGIQQVVPGHYPVRVVNATGSQSNSLTLSITQQSSSSLSISSVSGPTSLTTGSLGTWTVVVNAPYGAYLNAEVTWGDGTTPSIPNYMPSPYPLGGSQTLTFTHVYNNPGTFTITFNVSVGSSNTSATKTVTVTAAGGSTGSLNLSSLSPMQGSVGTTINLQGSGFTSTDNTVHFGIGGSRGVSSSNGTQISYVVPSYISACDLIQPGYFCGAPTQTVTPGVYPVYVTNSTGATNVLYFTVQ